MDVGSNTSACSWRTRDGRGLEPLREEGRVAPRRGGRRHGRIRAPQARGGAVRRRLAGSPASSAPPASRSSSQRPAARVRTPRSSCTSCPRGRSSGARRLGRRGGPPGVSRSRRKLRRGHAETVAVCDVGGNSTEIVVGTVRGRAGVVAVGRPRLRAADGALSARRPPGKNAVARRPTRPRQQLEIVPPMPQAALQAGGTARALRKLVGPELGLTSSRPRPAVR